MAQAVLGVKLKKLFHRNSVTQFDFKTAGFLFKTLASENALHTYIIMARFTDLVLRKFFGSPAPMQLFVWKSVLDRSLFSKCLSDVRSCFAFTIHRRKKCLRRKVSSILAAVPILLLLLVFLSFELTLRA